MKSARLHTKGFTLIASLLLLLLLSGIAIGLMMMVNTEGKVGGTDLQNNAAFHSAEGGIEKMTSDLAATFQSSQVPHRLSNLQPGHHATDLGWSHLERLHCDARAARFRMPVKSCLAVGTNHLRTEPGSMGADHPRQHAGDSSRARRAGSEHAAERAGGADSGVPVRSFLGERPRLL